MQLIDITVKSVIVISLACLKVLGIRLRPIIATIGAIAARGRMSFICFTPVYLINIPIKVNNNPTAKNPLIAYS